MAVRTNLILGGSGLIGKELQRQLLLKKEQVINLDIKEGTDLRNHNLDEYNSVDFVWFLAWDSGGAKYLTNEKNFLDIYKNNAQICNTVFSFIEKHNKAFLFTSSQLAASDNAYGLTKLLGEKWGELLGGKIVRLWNVYGWEEPDERSHVIPDLIMQALQNKNIHLMTSGEEKRQFIYVEDCVRNMLVIRNQKENNFCLTNGNWLQIKEVAETIAQLMNVKATFGKKKGYEYLIDPDFPVNQYSFNYTLQVGIGEIIKSAQSYLNKTNKKQLPVELK